MSLLVVSYPNPARALAGYGVSVSIDGQPVHELVDFKLEASIDDVVRATMRVNVTSPMDIQVDAEAVITYCPIPGTELIETTLPDGSRRIVARMLPSTPDPEFNE